MNKRRHARKYHEKLHGEYHNLSTKEYYGLGLFIGLYLRRSIYDVKTEKTKSRPHIWNSIQGGNPVYMVARDMTLVWEFLRDLYPNVIPVYNINRKATGETIDQSIDDQIDLKKKGLIVDTGFSGSMVKPILNRSHRNRDGKRLLKGLLLSAHSSINSYTDLYGISVEGENIYDAESYRNIITDLEHSPKLETTSEGNTVVNFADRNNRYFAFRLGFFAGLQGLNKAYAAKPMKREALIKRLNERREKAQAINDSISNGLHNVEIFARGKTMYSIVDTGNEYKVVRVVASDRELRYYNTVNTGYSNRYNTVYVKRFYASHTSAKKFADQLTKRYKRIQTPSNWIKHVRREALIKDYLERIERYETNIEQLKERIRNVAKDI